MFPNFCFGRKSLFGLFVTLLAMPFGIMPSRATAQTLPVALVITHDLLLADGAHELTAELSVGENTTFQQVSALSVVVEYPSALLQPNTVPTVQYAADDWFGASPEIVQTVENGAQTGVQTGVLKMRFTRQNGSTVVAFGTLAQLKFIVIDNIVGKGSTPLDYRNLFNRAYLLPQPLQTDAKERLTQKLISR